MTTTTLSRETRTQVNIPEVIEKQRKYFNSGATRSYEFRNKQLRILKKLFKENEEAILQALKQDLNKPGFEGYASEIGLVYDEINHTLSHLRLWMEPEKVSTPIVHAPSSSQIINEPRGVSLIIGAWNYPLQLIAAPLIAAMSAGNTAVLKPSELATASAELMENLIAKYFDNEYIAVVNGGVETTTELLKNRYDYIFFTGSTQIGKIIARAAAEHLTPTTLELGGKSPCIIDEKVNLDISARRIVWGKFFNAGQTCVAPDYILVPPALKEKLIERLNHYINKMYGADPRQSEDYARIISERHFDRLVALLDGAKVAVGGQSSRDEKYIAPTVLDDVQPDDKIMQEEIFGPILPILEYEGLDQAIETVKSRPEPLSLYLFSSNSANQKRVLEEIPFGGGCVNNLLVHLSNPNLPFGGRGDSGHGAYHGKYGFDTFSHKKSVMKTPFFPDPPIRYPAYGKKLSLLRWLMR